jgi:hypothetical protein
MKNIINANDKINDLFPIYVRLANLVALVFVFDEPLSCKTVNVLFLELEVNRWLV